MMDRDWLQAWCVLLVLGILNLVVLGAYAVHGLVIVGARGIPAAGFVMVGIGAVAIFVMVFVAALLLRAAIVKPVVSAVLIIFGVLALLQAPVHPELTASGIVGTSFVVVTIAGGMLGLHEVYVQEW